MQVNSNLLLLNDVVIRTSQKSCSILFVLLHGEQQYEFTFVETVRKSIIPKLFIIIDTEDPNSHIEGFVMMKSYLY